MHTMRTASIRRYGLVCMAVVLTCLFFFPTQPEEPVLLGLESVGWVGLTAQLWGQNHASDDDLSDAYVYAHQKTWPRPALHLLVDARDGASPGVCKTVMTALVNGYPPPILVGYRGPEELPSDEAVDEVILNIMDNYAMGDDDLVLYVAQDQWMQLPSEVLVRRFLQQEEVVRERLARAYGAHSGLQQSILLPATKMLQQADGNDSTAQLPPSSLPWDVYGEPAKSQKPLGVELTPPRFAGPGTLLGRAAAVARFVRASLAEGGGGMHEGEAQESAVRNLLLRRQEASRRERTEAARAEHSWLQGLGRPRLFSDSLPTSSAKAHKSDSDSDDEEEEEEDDDEFGAGLDHESRIFQTVQHSTDDLRYLTLDRPNLVRSPSRSAARLYRDPLRLPPELPPLGSPFVTVEYYKSKAEPSDEQGKKVLGKRHDDGQPAGLTNGGPPSNNDEHGNKGKSETADAKKAAQEKKLNEQREAYSKYEQAMRQREEEDRHKREAAAKLMEQDWLLIEERRHTVLWSNIPFATNIVVPRGSIPAVLDMRHVPPELAQEWWSRLWFRPHARLLMLPYLNPTKWMLTATAEWNHRGGRGGAWTDEGNWLRWDQFCEAQYDEELFA